MDPHSAGLLLLLLTCLAGVSTSETGEGGAMGETSYGPSSVEIDGVSVATVGITYFFQCQANCSTGCKFNWTRGNVTTQGPVLRLKLLHTGPTETLTCTGYNPATGKSASVQKMLQVTAGPSNITIIGPGYLTVGVVSNFSCSASCYPSCSYTWTVAWEGETIHTHKGDTLSLAPYASTVISESLTCVAEDTISHLFISTTEVLTVASTPSIRIQGPSTVMMGQTYSFTCYSPCVPMCSITWKYMGKTFQGDRTEIPIMHQTDKVTKFASHIEITVSDDSKIEPLTCVATNPLTHDSVNSTMDLTVIDPISVRPTSQALPVAGKAFSLQCVGSQNPASITWLKNKQPMPASERVHFTPDNVTVTFSPLLPADEGLYQCVVAEVGPLIQSVDYMMQVNYGPSSVVISGVDVMTFGISYDFKCSASCNPTCNFIWTWDDVTSQGPELSLRLVEPVRTLNLTCTAVNPTTELSVSTQKTLKVNAGPTNVQVSGPAFLTAGVASNFTCSANCHPSCNFFWTVTGEEWDTLITAEGSTVSVNLPASTTFSNVVLMCKAQDAVSHLYIEKARQLQLAKGPNEVHIVKPSDGVVGDVMLVQAGSTTELLCLTDCFPVCLITWIYEGTVLSTNASISFTPVIPPYAAALSCVASNPLTGKNGSAVTTVQVPDGPTNVVITGPEALEIGVTAHFVCSAECSPSCSFKWTLYGKTMAGSGIDITVNRHVSKEAISCQAENTFTRKTATVNETLSVSDPHWCGC